MNKIVVLIIIIISVVSPCEICVDLSCDSPARYVYESKFISTEYVQRLKPIAEMMQHQI